MKEQLKVIHVTLIALEIMLGLTILGFFYLLALGVRGETMVTSGFSLMLKLILVRYIANKYRRQKAALEAIDRDDDFDRRQ